MTIAREDENICRQCGELFEGDCLCRCGECNANIWPLGRCDYCAREADMHQAMREDEDDARRDADADAYAGDR